MRRITFLCSGGGGNLRLLHALCESGALGRTSVTAVIGDRPGPALEWASARGLHAELIPYTRTRPEALHGALDHAKPDLVVTNIHKILDEALVSRHIGRLLNLHYSLLPAFAGSIGMDTVRLARQRGCGVIGATAHHVTADVDAGPILAQAAISDDGSLDEPALFDAVFRAGGVALAAAVQRILDPSEGLAGGWFSAGGTAMLASPLPGDAARHTLGTPEFWAGLR
jgi:phosphoribosylglycinamide formyltransferase 1